MPVSNCSDQKESSNRFASPCEWNDEHLDCYQYEDGSQKDDDQDIEKSMKGDEEAELENETRCFAIDDVEFEAIGSFNDRLRGESLRIAKDVEQDDVKRVGSSLAEKAIDEKDPFSPISLLRRGVLSRPKSCDKEAIRKELSIGQPVRITLDEGETVGYPSKKSRKSKKRPKKFTNFMLTPAEESVKFGGDFGHFNPLPSIGKK